MKKCLSFLILVTFFSSMYGMSTLCVITNTENYEKLCKFYWDQELSLSTCKKLAHSTFSSDSCSWAVKWDSDKSRLYKKMQATGCKLLSDGGGSPVNPPVIPPVKPPVVVPPTPPKPPVLPPFYGPKMYDCFVTYSCVDTSSISPLQNQQVSAVNEEEAKQSCYINNMNQVNVMMQNAATKNCYVEVSAFLKK